MIRSKEKHPPGSTLLLVILIGGLMYLAWSVLHKKPIDGMPGENPWPDMRINVNSAPASHLQVLPGIGPQLAERIVAYREEHGLFTKLDDMKEVKFIGPSVIARIEPYVVLLPPDDVSQISDQDPIADN